MRKAWILHFTSFVVGCSQPATVPPLPKHSEVDHDDELPITKADVKLPATFAELVFRVKGYRDQIKAAIDAGKPSAGLRR